MGVYGWGTPKFSNLVPPVMPILTELSVRAAKAVEKPYKLYDERGPFMLVTPQADGFGASNTASVG